MKTKSKALAIISALMLCIVLLSGFYSVKVSALTLDFPTDYYHVCDNSSEFNSFFNDTLKKDTRYKDVRYNGKYYIFDSYDIKQFLSYNIALSIVFSFDDIPIGSDFYYIIFKDFSDPSNYFYLSYLSSTPIRLIEDGDYLYFISDSGLRSITCRYNTFGYTGSRNMPDSYHYPSDGFNSFQLYYKKSEYDSALNCNLHFSSYEFTDVYSNCSNIEFPDGYKFASIPGTTSLKSQIDVKLTPEFGLGMDRTIPNSAFNTSEDYWKLEVTNYNSCNIQFKCYIIPATGDVPYVDEWGHSDSLKEYAKDIPIDVNTDDFIPKVPDKTVWMLEKNQWIYSKETASQEEYYIGDPYLVNKPTSCFFIESGKTFTQMIKWNQLNLNKNQPYQLLVTACECPYDKASDIHISLGSDDYSQSLKHIINESYYIVTDITFSVKNPLVYNSNENYGGVIPNTGRQQVDDDYWKINAIDKDGEIEVRNADYVNGWRLNPDGSSKYDHWNDIDFDINIDSISPNNVMDYITFPKQYINLLKTFFTQFPSLWALIIFGLSACVVIAIIRYIKG